MEVFMLRSVSSRCGYALVLGAMVSGGAVAVASPITPVAQWQFNGNLNDSLGGFNLTFAGTNPASYVTTGGHEALALDGVDQHANVAVQSTALDFNDSSFTIAAWATVHLPPSAIREAMVVGRPNDSSFSDYAMTVDFYNQTNTSGNPVTNVYTGPGGGAGSVASTINYDQYVNIVMTYDQPTHTITLYRNAELRDSKSTGITGPIANSSLLEFGDASGVFLKADLDEVRIYSAALTQAEVTALYNSGDGPAAIPEPASLSLLGLGGLLMIRRRR
jgi:hypothetical protein